MLTLLALAPALAADPNPVLTPGEFRNNAYTMEKGDVAIHPFLKSHFGVADNVDVKTPILGDLLLGPRGSVEIAFVQTDSLAFSVEPELYTGWGFRNYGAGATGHVTFGFGANHLNLSAGLSYGHSYIADTDPDTDGNQSATSNGYGIPLNVGLDLGLSDKSALRFVGTTDAAMFGSGAYGGTLAANYNYAGGPVGLSLGLAVLYGGITEYDIPDELPLPVAGDTLIIPVPTIELWWRI